LETTGTVVTAINVFRSVITAFIVVLITIASTGWLWVGSHQSPSQALASRVVLTLCVVAGLIGVRAVWGRRG
jgi:membrane protein YdbS with pleckstrin-like domain